MITVIAKYTALGCTWLLISYIGYLIKTNNDKNETTKLKVMTCRKQIKTFKRLDDADNKSIF